MRQNAATGGSVLHWLRPPRCSSSQRLHNMQTPEETLLLSGGTFQWGIIQTGACIPTTTSSSGEGDYLALIIRAAVHQDNPTYIYFVWLQLQLCPPFLPPGDRFATRYPQSKALPYISPCRWRLCVTAVPRYFQLITQRHREFNPPLGHSRGAVIKSISGTARHCQRAVMK